MQLTTRVESFGTRDLSYVCKHCGHRAKACVVVTGKAAMPGWGSGSTDVARQAAARDADVLAERSLLFARCPECHERDPAATGYRMSRTLLALFVLISFIGIGLVISRRMPSPIDVFAVLSPSLAGTVMAARLYRYVGRPWSGAERRVSFD